MKVLHIINVLATGGAEKLLVEMLPEFERRNIDVHLLVFDGKDTIFFQMLKQTGFKKYQSLGLNINFYNPLIIFKLLSFFKDFDIIHTHLTQPQYWTAFARFLSSYSTKMVTSEHNTDNRRRSNKLLYFLDKFVYSKYDCIISVSEITQTLLKKYLLSTDDDNKFIVIPNGIDLKTQFNAEPLERNAYLAIENANSIKIIAMVARFNVQKDQPTLIRALKHLNDNVHIVLVGEGETMIDCKNLANDLNLSPRVHFLGKRKDVPNLLKSVDVIVMSSNYEGLSLFSLEGMASGKPFVASNAPGLKEIVEGAGVLFEIGDDKYLAEILDRIFDDSSFRDSIVDKCLTRAKDYDISIMVDKYIQIYRSL